MAESARRRIQLLQQELVQEERFIESVAAAIAHTSHAKQYTSVQQAKKKLDGVILTLEQLIKGFAEDDLTKIINSPIGVPEVQAAPTQIGTRKTKVEVIAENEAPPNPRRAQKPDAAIVPVAQVVEAAKPKVRVKKFAISGYHGPVLRVIFCSPKPPKTLADACEIGYGSEWKTKLFPIMGGRNVKPVMTPLSEVLADDRARGQFVKGLRNSVDKIFAYSENKVPEGQVLDNTVVEFWNGRKREKPAIEKILKSYGA